MKKHINIKSMVFCAFIAAIYAALTIALAPISFSAVQFRLSEALTLLPFIYPPAIPGLFIGCFIANIFTGNILDIVFGSIASLIAAYLTSKCKNIWIAALPPIFVNAIVIGAVLAFSFARDSFWASYALFGLQVGIGQMGVCILIGVPFTLFLKKYSVFDIKP